ncbi:NAD(P)-dependent alcohol dehydrogenase [Streptomyces griseoaurantiacus]|uniref:NAD(P)-dependent alcohol dehydrogenase n=1 Tax=Streptomyces griseoaurantiacus TaxID=68213 RepID=UPI00379600D4
MPRPTTAAVVPAVNAPFELRSVHLDDLRPDEVLVRLRAAGMCHTDLSARAGVIPFPLPGVLGHEGAGVVEAVGDRVDRVTVGDKVLMTFTSCGHCATCRSGHPAYCDSHLSANLLGGRRADGSFTLRDAGAPLHGHFFGQSSFAELSIADERSVIRLPEDITDDELIDAAPLGCGLQTGAGTVLNVLRPRPGATLAVAGAGAVGLAAVMAAGSTPAHQVIVIDRVASRLELAASLGATHTVNAGTCDIHAALMDLTRGRGVDAAIETTGNVGVLETLCDSLAILGTCAVIGAPPAGARAAFDVNALLPGRRIVGVTIGDSEPQTLVPRLLDLYRAGRFPLRALQRRYPFTHIEDAAKDAATGSTIKPVLVFEEQQ